LFVCFCMIPLVNTKIYFGMDGLYVLAIFNNGAMNTLFDVFG
jgi:hypothetical protein